ncbi:efflux RND transporter periplasmic adaptor subunit [Roseateles sp.]|uniref:efflux RND transporter periplasmic adaptor subunit n=1 Tax=Roseateles sp. TaxID=1971397 RepID=UPI003262EEDE
MKRAHALTLVAVAAAALLAGAFFAGRLSAGKPPTATPASTAASAPAPAPKVLYWHDPMVPGPRFDKPGKSPFMDMELVPVYADESGDPGNGGVRINATVQQNLGIRTAAVTRVDVASGFDAVGTVQFNERLQVAVQSRVAGFVERLYVRAPMQRVRQGDALATVFAPEWLGPQNELLALKRAGAAADLIAAARERLRAMSVPEALVRRSEEAGAAQARYTLSAPVGGVIAELGVRDGAAVSPGMTLFRIAGLSKVWAVIEVPEAQVAQLRPGQKVSATLQSDATRSFKGTLTEILPQVDPSTRTLQARFEVDNAAGQLTPGMLLRLQVAGASVSRLVVPAEAVIRTGARAVVIVRKANGAFEPRDVKLGAELGERFEVVEGLSEGDQVVASGQFLVDSEARLRSVLGGMAAASATSAASAASAPAEMPTPRPGGAQ